MSAPGLDVTAKAAAAELTRLCSAATGPIGVAVSGGSDSIALLCLAIDWAGQKSRDLFAFTFDHGLRPDAADEAASVAQFCASQNIPHRTLKWEAPTPQQSAARLARHGALATALREAGGSHLLMGHTLDDQRETFLMRAEKQSGWWGLAGMQPLSVSPAWPSGRGVFIARPLLSLRRADLRRLLIARSVRWHDDPSNTNTAYERVRARQTLAEAPETVADIDQTLSDLASLRSGNARAIADVLKAATVTNDGLISLPIDALPSNEERLGRCLSILLQCAGGHARPIDTARLATLTSIIAKRGPEKPRTLGGALVVCRKGELLIARDPGGAAGVYWQNSIFDGRFELSKTLNSVPEMPDAHALTRATLPPDGKDAHCIIADRLKAIGTSFAL